ncbi:hypothetical protein [Raoultella terrigena]|uniref:hypothetical protein n=1 Tax=Raoultella terrigena TaxID=577 RepID=UPI0015B97B7E|nr:hypothetical protein [Raoultella terrigena]NWK87023.1 hypothetical protein [Raoultella terrigena]
MTTKCISTGGVPVEVATTSDIPSQQTIPNGTAAQLQAGTDTTPRLFTAKMIHDEIARQIAAIPAS